MVCAGLLALAGLSTSVEAQSLKDILKSAVVKDAVTSLTGGKELTSENLVGTWEYVNPAVVLEGDNALKNVAASAASGEIEKKLQTYCDKVGIKQGPFSYTFNNDNTFTCLFKGKKLSGTYSLDKENKTIQLNFGKLEKLQLLKQSAQVVLTNDQLALLFPADKLLDFIGTLSSISGSATLKAVNSLAEQYDGVKVGFELKR